MIRTCHGCGCNFETKYTRKYCDKPECQKQLIKHKTKKVAEYNKELSKEKEKEVARLKYINCRGCYNRERNIDGEPNGACLTFRNGIKSITGTSFMKNDVCKARIDYGGLIKLEKKLLKGGH